MQRRGGAGATLRPMLRSAMRGVALAAALAATSCSWCHDRTNDLLDPFRIDVAFGPGLYVDARATDFLALGAGAHYVDTAGLHGRFVGTGELFGVGLPFFLLGHTEQDMAPLLADASEYDPLRDILTTQLLVTPAVSFARCGPDPVSVAERGVRVADLGATATLGIVGIGVGFSPGELLDLVLGFVGLDIAGDDVAGTRAADAQGEAKAAASADR